MSHTKTWPLIVALVAILWGIARIAHGAPPPSPPTIPIEIRLAIREAQVEVLSLVGQLDNAKTKLSKAVEDAKKACGGEITPSLTCAPPKEKKDDTK
jgi:hypothetical protein